MKFNRLYTKEGVSPFSTTEYEWRTSTIRHEDGRSASKSLEIEVPKSWSQLATDILAQKYVRRADVPQIDRDGNTQVDSTGRPILGPEKSVKQVVDRLAGCWRHWGEENGYFDSQSDAQIFYDEIAYMLLHQFGAPNSPQWFNTGLAWKYGIKGSAQGHWYIDPKDEKLKEGKDAYSHPQPHACFIQSVDDDLLGENGIYSLLQREGRIFKFGSGTGTNFSNIRGIGEKLGSGGVSSGLMSFLKIYDRAAGAIKSGGTTRRAAKMVCLDLDHPEVEDFIQWKSKEEQKVAALYTGSRVVNKQVLRIMEEARKNPQDGKEPSQSLIARVREALDMGMPEALVQKALQLGNQGITEATMEEFATDFEGNAYGTVSGQNSNNSVRVPNRFMSQVQKDGSWDLTSRTDGSPLKTLKAKKLWADIARAAWECADPGLQYSDTINDWHTCPEDGSIRGSNPCSEYMFLDDTACNLASLNLTKFVTENGEFQIASYEHAIRLWTTVLEISVTMAQFPSREIARRSYYYRTLGLGYANLGSVLMRMGLPYDSKESSAFTGCVTALMCGISYATSAELARDLGPFKRYEANKKHMLRIMRNHRRAAYNNPISDYEHLGIAPIGIQPEYAPTDMLSAARRSWDVALEWGEQYGYRNAQVTVIAPTGTIGLLMDCDTTGIEPDFALIKFKKLSGGGYFKIINQSIAPALKKLGYTPQQIREIEFYVKGHSTLEGAPHINLETLLEKGFDQNLIKKIEASLPSAFTLDQVFNVFILGKDALQSKLNFSEEEILSPGFNLLRRLGFTEEQIEEAGIYVCGTQTIENAPHLMREHYPIFDCANLCGPRGTRFIAASGHLRIMAAGQSFISGAISKTINLPVESSLKDVEHIYKQAWEMGIKAVALYRDNCKLSQPLSSGNSLPQALRLAKALPQGALEIPIKVNTESIQGPRRRKLPTKRSGFVQEAMVGGHKIFLRTGEYPDGSIGEIFIDMYKEGASYRSLLNCFAVLASKAIQYGVPLQELVDSFTFTRFEPSGPVVGHEHIRNATSILDFVFRTLGHHYLQMHEFLHIKPSVDEVPIQVQPAPSTTEYPKTQNPIQQSTPLETVTVSIVQGSEKAVFQSKLAGYTGDSCGSCGSMRVRRNGTCTVCDDCGATSGCS